MNKNVGIAVVVGIAVIFGVVGFQIYDSTYQKSTVEEYYADQEKSENKVVKHVVYPENPQTLYGLTINKDKYLLGENIFLKVNGIPPGLKDTVLFFTPEGINYLQLPFDGDEKSSFKHYFRPALTKSIDRSGGGLCDKEQLVGEWTVMFASMSEDRIYFQVMDETLPHSEQYYKSCLEQSMQIPGEYIQPSLGQ
tara:strand:+ start:404 stop:985 length:582 start_codon:yes stop_codon:yes gene_type:complete